MRFVSFTFLVGFGFGAFVGVALALLAVAISRPQDEEPQRIEIPVIPTPTALPEDTPRPSIRATAALAVRVGPGEQFATLGTLSRGDAVDVLGRDFDSEWLAISFPRGSSARGWIPAADVEGLNLTGVEALTVLLPTPLPIEFNTPPPFLGPNATPDEGTPGVEEEATPNPLAGKIDMAIFEVTALPDGRVRVEVVNSGPAHLRDELLIVTVRKLSGVGETMTFGGVILAGTTMTFETSTFRVGPEPENVQVVIDPGANLDDPDRTNNVANSLLSTGSPTGAGAGGSG